MSRLGGTAVVIGAGVAGLSAAQALAEFFEAVILLERDDAPAPARPRPGVPQGTQPHLLLAGGFEALRDLFPGLERDLLFAGAIPFEAGQDIRCEIPGLGSLPKRDFGVSSFAMTRPVLEEILSRQAAAHGRIEFRHGVRAYGLRTSLDGEQVTGVRCEGPDGEPRVLGADLVVDATGRAALTTACLDAMGRAPPRQTLIGIDLGYSTGTFSIPASAAPDFVAMVTHPEAPHHSRSGYMLQIREELWQVLLVGRGSERPPGDVEGFLAFARTLATPTIANAIAGAGLPDEISRFGFRASVRRHFGEDGPLPQGLLPIGDSICRFNPVHGQGMSVAAIEARLLRETLAARAGIAAPLKGLAEEFLARVEPLITAAWEVSAIPDFAYPQTEGARPADLEEKLRAQGEMFGQAMGNPAAHRALLGRMHLLAAQAEARPVELA